MNQPSSAAMEGVTVRLADLGCPRDGETIVALLENYASADAIGSPGLPTDVRDRVVSGLADRPHAVVLLAEIPKNEVGTEADRISVGMAICFEVYSTFAAAPVINIHDMMVHSEFRGRRIGRHLMDAAEKVAVERDCCKLTLEVYRNNEPAMRLYRGCDFRCPGEDTAEGETLFFSKKLEV